MSTTPDRISYSHGFKVPGAEQYSSVNVSVSLSTDVRDDETIEDAMERARDFVHRQAERDMPRVAPAAPRAPAAPPPRADVQDERFDPNNPVHRRLAESVLDHERVKSEKSRKYKIEVLLKGKRVGDIGQIVRDDMEEFRRGQVGGPWRGSQS